MTDRRRYSSARTEDSYDYSDDFSEDDIAPVKSAPEKQRTRGRGRNQGKGRGRGRGQGRNSQARSDTHVDVVTKRLLSANRLKVNELQNQVEEMKKQMKLVTDENKLFKRMQHKQEKALVKFEDRESELPQLIQTHNNEVRTLREQLRRTREKYEKTDRYLRDAEDELERVNTKCKKYKALSDQKDLAERSDLDRRLNKSELAIEEKECRIRELERHMENLKKNHRHELGIERARYKETQRQLEEIKDTNSKLEIVLREKEKQLDAQNIYSNRLGKPASYNGTPAGSPAPWRQNLKKKSESMSDLGAASVAARDKSRAYEEKRKAQRKEKLRLPKLPLSPKKPVQEKPARSREPKQKWEEESREKDEDSATATTTAAATTTATATATAEVPNFTFNSLQRQDSEADFWRRQEERYKQDKDNREKQEEQRKKKAEEEEREEREERARFQQQRDKFKRDMEERERRERERKEADEREQRLREEREREKKDAEQQQQRERERQRRENERRVQDERDRLDNDPRLAEERRKKDELLRRLQQLDGNRDGAEPATSDPFAPSEKSGPKRRGGGDPVSDPFAVSPPNRRGADKDPFGDSSFSSPSSKKDYAFTRSIENMHKGKPAHEDVSVPYIDRQKKGRAAAKEDEDVVGYQPSFSSPGKAPSSGKKKNTLSLFDNDDEEEEKVVVKPAAKPDPHKKSKLMADLFGSQASSSSSRGPSAKREEGGGDFFLTSKEPAQKQAPGKKASGFPWDDSPAHGKTNGTSHRESSTLFGGGAALVEEDLNGNSGGSAGAKSTMLPKRSRQAATTFNSKPAMVAVDSLDDDIEEVVF